MKFIYVDESGDRSQGEVFVMGGLMVDAYKLRKKTADVYERLKRLSKQHEGEKFELKTKRFIEGRGGWKSISRLERQNILSGLIRDALHGGSEVFAIGLTFKAFDNANSSNLGQPFGKNYWVGSAMFISALVQRQNQKLSGNKGNTVFIVDENMHETSKLSDCLVPQTGCQDDILPLYSNSIFRKQLWDRYYTPTQSLPMRLEKRSKKRPHRSQIAHYQGATD